MEDRGFFLTLQAIRRQLAAMPNDLYLVRLIHHRTRQAFPGEHAAFGGQPLRAAGEQEKIRPLFACLHVIQTLQTGFAPGR